MRGALPVDAALADRGSAAAVGAVSSEETTYSSPEMRDYLAPLITMQPEPIETTVARKAIASSISISADQKNDTVANSQSLLTPSSA